MDKNDKLEEIDNLCRMHGCSPEDAKRHRSFYLNNWNVHPPEKFRDWLRVHEPNTENVISAWNSAACRNDYYAWIEMGEPAPAPLTHRSIEEHLSILRAAVAKINKRNEDTKRDNNRALVTEDAREHGYDKR